MTAISISRLHYPITTLGPGKRVGIWFQGCSIRCPACISADTWAPGRGTTSVAEVLDAAKGWLSDANGVTISGGEPFDQPDALVELVTGLKAGSDADILVYTGHPLERVQPILSRLPDLIDAIISDPYLIEAPQTKALRGSDNQRLTLLTALGHSRFASFEREYDDNDRWFDIMVEPSGDVWLAGIPGKGDFEKLKSLLSLKHHKITTTQDRSHGDETRR